MFIFRDKGKQSDFKIQALEERDSSGDSEYWAKYAKLIDPQKERLWDALIEGLEKYRYVMLFRTDKDIFFSGNTKLIDPQKGSLR